MGLVSGTKPYMFDLSGSATDLIRKINQVIRTCTANCRSPLLWTSLQVNLNTVRSVHTGHGNRGVSVILGLGDYTNGELKVATQTYDIKDRGLLFDGLLPHKSLPFEGCRISIVAFTSSAAETTQPGLRASLRRLGFPEEAFDPRSAITQNIAVIPGSLLRAHGTLDGSRPQEQKGMP